MTMDESGRAIRELLAALYGAITLHPRDLAAARVLTDARTGGRRGVKVARELIAAGRAATASAQAWTERAEAAERDLGYAQATIRAMVGQAQPEDVRVPIDPPKGHEWVTMAHGQPEDQPMRGRLWCVTCSQAGPVVLAAECLERSR